MKKILAFLCVCFALLLTACNRPDGLYIVEERHIASTYARINSQIEYVVILRHLESGEVYDVKSLRPTLYGNVKVGDVIQSIDGEFSSPTKTTKDAEELSSESSSEKTSCSQEENVEGIYCSVSPEIMLSVFIVFIAIIFFMLVIFSITCL